MMLRTWLIPRHGEGNITVLFRAPRPVNTISFDFKQFSFKLFVSAQSCTCFSSLALMFELTAGTIMYVSSANLTSALPTCIDWRSDAVTTKDAEAYCRALDDAGQDVRQFGSVALNSGTVRMAIEEVLDPIVYSIGQG